jgi:2-dehydropantoate 2-reductase
MRWKYTKLMMNLRNSIDALISDPENAQELLAVARQEAEACLDAAGIDKASDDDDRARRDGVMQVRPIPGSTSGRAGGSTWQSLARGATTTEVDWLNGEIVLLGRLHGVLTPVNTMLCDVTRWAVANGAAPRSMTTQQMLAHN